MRLLLLLAAFFACALAQCVFTDKTTGHTWDLTAANQANDYVTAPNQNKEVFYFQPCQATVACKAVPPPSGPWTSPLCQKDGVGAWHSCGTLISAAASFGADGLTLAYNNGDNGRTAQVKYICGNNMPGEIVGEIGEPGGKLYVVNFKSKVGCYKGQSGGGGGGDKFDGGWVFVIIVLCGLTVYFLAGFIFLKFVRGANGTEAIPQGDFWLALPGLVKDGSMFIVAKTCGGGGGSSAGYQQVK